MTRDKLRRKENAIGIPSVELWTSLAFMACVRAAGHDIALDYLKVALQVV